MEAVKSRIQDYLGKCESLASMGAKEATFFHSVAPESVRRAPSIEFKVKRKPWAVRSAQAKDARRLGPAWPVAKGESRFYAGEHP